MTRELVITSGIFTVIGSLLGWFFAYFKYRPKAIGGPTVNSHQCHISPDRVEVQGVINHTTLEHEKLVRLWTKVYSTTDTIPKVPPSDAQAHTPKMSFTLTHPITTSPNNKVLAVWAEWTAYYRTEHAFKCPP